MASRRLAPVMPLLAAAVLSATPGVGGQTSNPSRLVTDVSEMRLRSTVRDLVALGPRTGGTASGDAAAALVGRVFRDAGLDTTTVADPEMLAYAATRWEVRLSKGGVLASAWPFRFSPAVTTDPVPLIHLPSAADAPAQSWRGRIVYTLDVTSAALARFAADARPPLAILTSAGTSARAPEWLILGEVPRPPARGIPVFALNKSDAVRVEAAARAQDSAVVTLSAGARPGAPRTVIGTLRSARSDRYYLVSAHGDSDSGGPGADDNASGVAAVLELAQVLSRRVRDGDLALPFSVRFAVWGAEYVSSRAYIAREGARLDNCLGVINVDEVGTGAEREAIFVEGNDVDWNRGLLSAFAAIGRTYQGPGGLWPEFATTPSQGGTDAYSFLPPRFQGTSAADLRIPSVTVYTAAWNRSRRLRQPAGWESNSGVPDVVITDYSRVYHSAGDIPENTTEREPQNMVRAVRLMALTIERLARDGTITPRSADRPRAADDPRRQMSSASVAARRQ